MDLVVETNYQRLRVIETATQQSGRLTIAGVASQVDVLNKNGRVYPKATMEREISRMVEGGLSRSDRIGAVNHPHREPRVEDLALKFTSLSIDGSDVLFEAEVLGTSRGKDLEALIRAGVEVGISSRGYATMERGQWKGENASIIQPDFELVTFDAVVEPSVADARIRSLEALNRVIDRIEHKIMKISEDKLDELIDQVVAESSGTSEDGTPKDPEKDTPQPTAVKTPQGKPDDPQNLPPDEANAQREYPAGGKEPPAPETAPINSNADGAPPKTSATPESIDDSDDESIVNEAVWSTAYKDALPDSAFLYVKGDVRKFPYKDKDGKVDPAHIKNALSRIPQAKGLSQAEKDALIKKAQGIAKTAGIDVGEAVTPSETTLEASTETPAAEGKANAEGAQKESATTEKVVELGIKLTEAEEKLASAESALAESRSRVATLESHLKPVLENADSLLTFLAAIKTALVAELGDNDWDDASFLAAMGQEVSWRQVCDVMDDAADDMEDAGDAGESKQNRLAKTEAAEGLRDILHTLVQSYHKSRLESHIAAKTADERFGKAIANVLRKSANTIADVDEQFEKVKSGITLRNSGDKPAVQSRGAVTKESTDTPRYTKEEIHFRQLRGLPV